MHRCRWKRGETVINGGHGLNVQKQPKPKLHPGLLALLGAGQALCYLYLHSRGDLRVSVTDCLPAYLAACGLYFLSLYGVKMLSRSCTPAGSSFFCIVCFAVCFRAVMLASPPALSDDIYRYVWEGRLTAAGLNPFLHAPADDRLAGFRDAEIYPGINNRQLPAIYPPLSQMIFALTTLLSPSTAAMKVVFMLFDLATIWVLLLILQALGLDRLRVIIYAWNPLVIIEFAGSGHFDSAGIFFFMLALLMYMRRSTAGAAAALACSFLTKFLAIVMLPFIAAGSSRRAVLIFAGIAAACYLPFAGAGSNLLYSLSVYAGTWMFNASFYYIAALLTGSCMAARALCAGLFLLLWIYLAAAQRRHEPLSGIGLCDCALVLLGAVLLLSPVVHPWYVCWIIPLLAVRPCLSGLFFSAAVFLSYDVLKDYVEAGIWAENPTITLAEYVPFYCLLLYDFFSRRLRFP